MHACIYVYYSAPLGSQYFALLLMQNYNQPCTSKLLCQIDLITDRIRMIAAALCHKTQGVPYGGEHVYLQRTISTNQVHRPHNHKPEKLKVIGLLDQFKFWRETKQTQLTCIQMQCAKHALSTPLYTIQEHFIVVLGINHMCLNGNTGKGTTLQLH